MTTNVDANMPCLIIDKIRAAALPNEVAAAYAVILLDPDSPVTVFKLAAETPANLQLWHSVEAAADPQPPDNMILG